MKNKKITRHELIRSYIVFFKIKNHKEIKNSSLVPENDPTVLFTTAGMHPLIPYLLGKTHPQGKRLVNVQRCIRTNDIEEVGDTVHHTFFEMLGNWSLGDYFKVEAIEMSFEFLTKILKIPINKLGITCFSGDNDSPKDSESANIWMSHGISKERIAFLGKKDNWWETPGKGPCGPDTEMFYYSSNNKPPIKFNPNDKNWVEIGNDVIMEFYKDDNKKYTIAKQKNIDFGGGVERTLAILNGYDDNYQTEIWKPIIKKIEEISNKKYKDNLKEFRIIADHIKASAFIIADRITPSNLEQGYILRRLIRRAIRNLRKIGMQNETCISEIAKPVFEIYKDYKHLINNKQKILDELTKEENRFLETLDKGINIFNKLILNKKELSGKEAFLLFQSYGFPLEITQELAKENKIKVNSKEFEKELKSHQELSRTATKGKFKSGLGKNSQITTNYHTTTHLLHAALRKILGNEVVQKGSNITQDRLRFDFSFERKLTPEEIKKVQDLVNKQIKNNLIVTKQELTPKQAKDQGAIGLFDDKYKNKVSVYTIGDFSKEICAGPHTESTKNLGTFKIKKEESSSAGVRRIKAELL
ncbi:alanine--tRNA ligase [Candidatus Pacearchaeota archaeon]|nr:alanine--tRNA ligase [Candidatus Pacearchaeota archaeon]